MVSITFSENKKKMQTEDFLKVLERTMRTLKSNKKYHWTVFSEFPKLVQDEMPFKNFNIDILNRNFCGSN